MTIPGHKRLKHATTLVALMTIVSLTACAPSQIEFPPATTAAPGGGEATGVSGEQSPAALRVAMAHPPGTLDPALLGPQDTAGRILYQNLYLSLTELDPVTGTVLPEFAESWAVSANGLRWTFELRDDAQWVTFDAVEDEVIALRPVTAHDVVTAIWRACAPNSDVLFARWLFVVEGCRDISLSDPVQVDDATMLATIEAVAVDDTTLSIALDPDTDTGIFLSLTTLPAMAPVPPEKLAGGDPSWANASNGAFALAAETPDSQLSLVRNSFYPLPRAGNVRTIEMIFAGSEQAAFGAFQAGEADLAPLPPGQSAPATLAWLEQRVTLIAFALDQNPMEDVRVRAALAEAFDRQRIVDEVLGGQGQMMAGFAPPGTVAYPGKLETPVYNPDFARDQLRDAGYPNCAIFPRLTVMVDLSEESEALAQALIQSWQEVLGCNDTRFELRRDSLRQVLATVNTPLQADWQTRPHIYVLTWQADYPDAHNWYGDVLHCQRGYLQLGRDCGQIDDLIAQAAGLADASSRAGYYGQVESLLFGPNGVYAVQPVYMHSGQIALQAWVTTGGVASVFGPFTDWSLDEQARP